MGLAEELQKNSIVALKNEVFAGLQREIDGLITQRKSFEDNIRNINVAIDSKTEALRIVKSALEGIGVTVQRKAEDLFFIDSRTLPKGSGRGHWMERIPGTTKVNCSCAGYRYNGTCWASDHINANLSKSKPDLSWRYTFFGPYNTTPETTFKNFDARVRPSRTQTIGPAWLLNTGSRR